MEYRKEQGYIVAYDENNKLRGKWNIVSNTYIGVKGNPIKSVPTAFKVGNNTNMPVYIERALELIHHYNSAYDNYIETRGQRMEQLISLQLTVAPSWETWDFLCNDKTRLTKDVVNYLNDNCGGIYDRKSIEEYKFCKKYGNIMLKYPEHRRWIYEILRETERNDNLPQTFVEGMIARAIREKVFYSNPSYSFARLLSDWEKMVRDMGDTLEVKPNILTNYGILQYLHDEWENSHMDEQLAENNDCPFLYYENDDFIVRPLLNRKAFHEEAEAQHNCVERLYMRPVSEGRTHVVTIRRKSNPTRSYVTCEVSNKGKIIQYLLACNQYPRTEKELLFKTEYQHHLNSCFENQ